MTRCESFDFYSLQRHNDTTTTSSHTLGHTHSYGWLLVFFNVKRKDYFSSVCLCCWCGFLTVSCFSFFKLTSHGTMELQVFLVVWLYYGSHHIHLFWPQNTIESIIHIICLWCWNLFQWPEEKRSNLPTYLPTYNLTPTSGELNLNTKWMDGWKANEAFQNILGVAQTAETSTVCYKDDYEEEDIFGRFLKKKKNSYNTLSIPRINRASTTSGLFRFHWIHLNMNSCTHSTYSSGSVEWWWWLLVC